MVGRRFSFFSFGFRANLLLHLQKHKPNTQLKLIPLRSFQLSTLFNGFWKPKQLKKVPTKDWEMVWINNPPKNQWLEGPKTMGYRFVRFRGGCPFFQIMIPVQCYTKHIQTPFINKEKDFGSSPGNAHCENSAKVLMWWPPRNGEIWAPMICKRKTLVDFLISCAFGMNFLSKCKKKNIPSPWRKKKIQAG